MIDRATIARIIKSALGLFPETLEHLSADALKLAAGYEGIRIVMHGAVFGSVFGYLSGGSIADARNRMSNAVAKAYVETADFAYVEGGGELPLDDETAAWAREQLTAQFGFIDDLFDRLKEIRKKGDFDAGEIANARADGYASGLDQFYSETKTRGAKNKMLTFVGSDGKESCKDCQRMKGQRHRASWWIKNDLVPGSSKYECGGWNCEHYLIDDQGNQFTI